MPKPAIPLLALVLLTAGCTILGLGPQPAPPNARELAKLPYPKDAKYGDDLDILALRQGSGIDLVNRTPRAYDNVQLWLNQQYVLPVKRLEIGQEANHFDLGDFVNSHGEPYPLGGLLTPDRDQVLVLAELYEPADGLRHHLLVRHK